MTRQDTNVFGGLRLMSPKNFPRNGLKKEGQKPRNR